MKMMSGILLLFFLNINFSIFFGILACFGIICLSATSNQSIKVNPARNVTVAVVRVVMAPDCRARAAVAITHGTRSSVCTARGPQCVHTGGHQCHH